jgi:hypothetical protein
VFIRSAQGRDAVCLVLKKGRLPSARRPAAKREEHVVARIRLAFFTLAQKPLDTAFWCSNVDDDRQSLLSGAGWSGW